MENVCSKVVLHLMHQTLAAAFNAWEDCARTLKRSEGICACVLKHWMHRTTAAAFESWHSSARKQRRAEDICSRVLSRWTHRTAAGAFENWYILLDIYNCLYSNSLITILTLRIAVG